MGEILRIAGLCMVEVMEVHTYPVPERIRYKLIVNGTLFLNYGNKRRASR